MRPSTTTADPSLIQGPSRADLEEARPDLKIKRWINRADGQVMTEIADTVNTHFTKCLKANIAYDMPESLAALTRPGQYISHADTARRVFPTMGPGSSRADILDLITCLQTVVRRAHAQDYDTCDPGTGTNGAWSFT